MATTENLGIPAEEIDIPLSKADRIPHIIKYMGSKKPIIDFIIDTIDEVADPHRPLCDLFSGSCSISAALAGQFDFYSNDIQEYSGILGEMYFSDLSRFNADVIIAEIDVTVKEHVSWFRQHFAGFFYDYSTVDDVVTYQSIELAQRSLVDSEGFDIDFHLFTKYYAGTYWSFEQCVYIDALRKAATRYQDQPVYFAIMSAVMYAMSYTTQSTGHFAQYRDGDTPAAMNNILTYRVKSIFSLFTRKLKELIGYLREPARNLVATTMSFEACLQQLPEGITIYADPPYAPVHYSRFYHALETLVKYDYPVITHKGRYRSDRHQSPFSQKGNALAAFATMFDGIIQKHSQLILSYSGSGVVAIGEIRQLAQDKFDPAVYDVTVRTLDHKHSTMGRFEDHERDVTEYLIIARLKVQP